MTTANADAAHFYKRVTLPRETTHEERKAALVRIAQNRRDAEDFRTLTDMVGLTQFARSLRGGGLHGAHA